MGHSLEILNEIIEAELPVDEARTVRALAKEIYQRAGPDFLGAFDGRSLFGLATRARAFLQKREQGEVLVDVYTPELEQDGWEIPCSVLQIALEDRPFIVDSIRAELRRHDLKPFHYLHPILNLHRTPSGHLARADQTDSRVVREAYELILMPRRTQSEGSAELEESVRRVLADVVLATEDHLSMRERALGAVRHLESLLERLPFLTTEDTRAELEESIEFIRWLLRENFIFLGYRVYQVHQRRGKPSLGVVPDSALGILRRVEESNYFRPVPLSRLPPEVLERLKTGPVLLVSKTNSESTVHRPSRMDYVGLKTFDQDGQPDGEVRFLGLLTSKAHATPIDEVPILRRKLEKVLEMDQSLEGSHDFKRLVSIFNSMPKEELFWSSIEELYQQIRTIIGIEEERGVHVTVRADPFDRGLAIMVIMPRERFNSSVRKQIQDLLSTELKASHIDYRLAIGEDEAQVRFHFFVTTRYPVEDLDFTALNRQIAELTRTWDDQVAEVLIERHGSDRGQDLAQRYAKAFGEVYRAENSAGQAAKDIEILEQLGDDWFHVDLEEAAPGRFPEEASLLKIYHQQATLALSLVFPVLDNLGLNVIEQISYAVRPVDPRGSEPAKGIDIFRVQDRFHQLLNLAEVRDRMVEALSALLKGTAENHRLNQLIPEAGLRVREIALLRAYQNYLAQLQASTSRSFITETLLQNPRCARILSDFFRARFDPQFQEREEASARIRGEFLALLREVASLPADEALRSLFQLMEATVRTNFYLDRPCISVKVRSEAVRQMPDPRPLFEIFVTSLDMEGIHLRGGRVARGGIRWSDRLDDFRTEILGLMKTQMTKNAVIVPVGSKGGFVLRRPAANPDELREQVKSQYRTFIRGLLDLTDNRTEGATVSPQGLVLYDEPDPYLVVAADKGTATFSDLANAISAEFDFWLGDAFASGGSDGYDHKNEGITARGVWECVARHFREMGHNIRKDEFTATGIGDMSGDVFGNGMLYTDKVRLLAAFNHQHIFVDPDPDTSESFRERNRLFQLPGSSWEDYNRDLISTGGGVFPRQAKAITLSPQMQQLLESNAGALSGDELVTTILRMPVDLLWNGGIGTYVKSSQERHGEVGDSSNDGVRIDATELRSRVVGEGGNLGVTQLGRIEFALRGGRINTDAIDNSGGVDMSDHEVNLKILCQPLVRSGEWELEERNRRLRDVTDEVARLVLTNNYRQSLSLSLAERASRNDLRLFRALIEDLVEAEGLKTQVEFLPDAKTLQLRADRGEGLTRPELAVLLAYTKMAVQRRLLDGDLLEDPRTRPYLDAYFPAPIREELSAQIPGHPLRREIVACQISNVFVDHLGMTFLTLLAENTGAEAQLILKAVLGALEILQPTPAWEGVFRLDNLVPVGIQYDAIERIARSVQGVVEWLLFSGVLGSDIASCVEPNRNNLLRLKKELEGYLPARERKRLEKNVQGFARRGLPEQLSRRIVSMDYLPSVLGVLAVCRKANVDLDRAARDFYLIGERLSMGWIRDGVAALSLTNRWEKMSATGLVNDLRRIQCDLTLGYLALPQSHELSVHSFLRGCAEIIGRFDRLLKQTREEHSLSLASASVLARLLAQVAEQIR